MAEYARPLAVDAPVEIGNKFFVGSQNGTLVFLRPLPQALSPEDALLLAAWLVTMVGDDQRRDVIRKTVEGL